MGFMDNVQQELNGKWNRSRTDNGALVHRTSTHPLLDMNFAVSSLRSASEDEICRMFWLAVNEDPKHALKWLFFTRDVRGGLGERRLFRTVMQYMVASDPDLIHALIPLVPEYGRWDDLWCLLDTDARDDVVKFTAKQFKTDLEALKSGASVSLLGKWLPSANTSSSKTRRYANMMCSAIGMTPRMYRKALSALREKIRVTERLMSANKWDEIEYEHVPSRANLLYGNAFLRHDESRRRKFLQDVKDGKKDIHASVLYPHDIVNRYNSSIYRNDDTLEALWKALPDTVQGNGSTLCVADGSGSMSTRVSLDSSVTCLDVANALAIYFAERCAGEFRNTYITFSHRPRIVRFKENSSLREKIIAARANCECSNTNIEAVFYLILSTAVNNKMPQEELPKTVLVLSDMQFDGATCGAKPNQTLFEAISERYKANGYTMPRLVFWNIDGRTDTIPVIQNEAGVALVSGFSVNVVDMVLSGKLDPYECLLEKLDSKRYDAVEEAIGGRL